MRPQLGIVVTPAEVQFEGLETVLDNVAERAGASMVSTTLGVFEPVADGEGQREPPLDVLGHGRLLDRPLWGRRSLWVRSYVPSDPDPDLYAGLPYPAPKAAPRPELRIDVPRLIVDGARARGLGVSVRINPYNLPSLPGGQTVHYGDGANVEGDRPVRIDGSVADSVLAGHGCLNNPNVRALGRARMRDALRRYPDVDAVYIDWAEYTCYFLEDAFTCFCPHCESAARARGLDWERVVGDVRAAWDGLHRLTPETLALAARAGSEPAILAGLLIERPGVGEWLRLKAASVAAAVADLRATMDAEGGRGVALGANGFAPPWSHLTGFEPAILGRECQELLGKLFTFHWPMIVRWYAESILRWNPTLAEGEVIAAVRAALDLPSWQTEHRRTLADYGMPLPDEPHLLTRESLIRKTDQLVALARGTGAAVAAYVHSYRPADEWREVLRAAKASRADTCWVQRYGYLSDEKLDIIREVWGGG